MLQNLVLFLTLSCFRPAASDDLTVELQLAEAIGTVATASWGGGVATVDVELDGEWVLTTEGDGDALLVGLATATTYDVLVTHADGRTAQTTLETGNAPTTIPTISTETFGQPIEDGWIIGTFVSSVSGPIVLNHDGQPVWWVEDDRAGALISRTWLLPDGSGVAYGVSENDLRAPDRLAEIIEISWDHTQRTVIDVPDFHHDFVQLPDGYAAIISDVREIDGNNIYGDALVEVHGDEQTVLWTVWDDRPWDEDKAHPDEPRWDWSHANAVDYDVDTDTYTLSMRNLNTIVHLDGATGQELWAHGEGGDFPLVGDAERGSTVLQHQFDLEGDSLLVFDNGASATLDSRVVEYTLDFDAGTAEEVWTYRTDPALFTYALGNVGRLPDGDRLITWSTGGQLEKVSDDGTLQWRLNTEIGAALGYMEWVPALR